MIPPTLARLIVQEHLHKPMTGPLLCLGKQTVPMGYEETLCLFRDEGYVVPRSILDAVSVEHDQGTRWGKKEFITDDLFFRLLGVEEVVTMDVSDYEGADIIHDLNKPVGEDLIAHFDFIIDGGTFDHLFDVRIAFENVVRMLRPGGRIFQCNAASNFTGAAYISFGPDLFYDYYVVNQFVDCRVCIADLVDIGQRTDWDLYEFSGADSYGHFCTDRIQVTIVLAEKGIGSTYDQMPIQTQYRSSERWGPYRAGQALIMASSRPGWPSVRMKDCPEKNPEESNVVSTSGAFMRSFRARGAMWCFMRLICRGIEKLHKVYLRPYSYGDIDGAGNKKPNNVPGFRYLGKV